MDRGGRQLDVFGEDLELIRRLKLAQIARRRVQAFKPAIDDRYGTIQARKPRRADAHGAADHDLDDLERSLDDDAEVVGIDEGQFLGEGLVDLCERLADRGKRVVVAGLDQDWKGQPFPPWISLMAVSESVTKVLAICTVCGNPANRSQRVVRGRICFRSAPPKRMKALPSAL